MNIKKIKETKHISVQLKSILIFNFLIQGVETQIRIHQHEQALVVIYRLCDKAHRRHKHYGQQQLVIGGRAYALKVDNRAVESCQKSA